MAGGHAKTPSQPCLSDPNLGVWWPWPAPHPFLILRATSVPFPRTPKWLVILKHHLGAPFVFSGEVSEGLSLGLNLIPHFHINCSVYGRSERTVNNERVMLNMKLDLGTDMLHLSFFFTLYESSQLCPGSKTSNTYRVEAQQAVQCFWDRKWTFDPTQLCFNIYLFIYWMFYFIILYFILNYSTLNK